MTISSPNALALTILPISKPAALYSLCRIHVKCQIQHQIQRYNSSQSHHIKDKPKSVDHAELQTYRSRPKIWYANDGGIYYNMNPIKIPLVILNQIFSPIIPPSLHPGRNILSIFQAATDFAVIPAQLPDSESHAAFQKMFFCPVSLHSWIPLARPSL